MRLLFTSITICSCDSGVTSVGSRPQRPSAYRTHEIKYEERYKQELMQWIDDVMVFLEQGFEPPLPHDFTREDFLKLKKQYPDAPFMDDFLRERGRR